MRKRNRNFKEIGLAGILAVGLSVAGLPAEPVSAVNGWDVDLNAGGTAEASSVSITMGGGTANGQLNAGSTDPNKSAGLVKRTASVEIGATDGYTVTLSGNPNLTGVNSSNKIPTVTSNTTLAQMNNQWGWYTAEGDVDCSALQTMKQMKSTGDQIATGTLNAKTTKQFTMCFGAKVNGNQAADTYSNTVTLSVVAQPKVVQMFGGIKTMQAMTSDICKAASVNDTAYLRDTRDNKSYWVTKLADGNCWMSQNLDLDLSNNVIVANVSDKSTAEWSGAETTVAASEINSTTLGYGNGSKNGTWSWDLGEYVLNTPTANGGCSNNEGLNTAACALAGFINVTGWVPSDASNFYQQELYKGVNGGTCTKIKNTAVNANATGECRVYDAHYLVGNYYQWYAATAGVGDKTRSICPRGWELPSFLNEGSYDQMLTHYGVNGSVAGTAQFGGVTYNYNIALRPLFFVSGGAVYPGSSTRFSAGDLMSYWLPSAYEISDGMIYALVVNKSTGVVNSHSRTNSPSSGYSMRCAFLP